MAGTDERDTGRPRVDPVDAESADGTPGAPPPAAPPASPAPMGAGRVIALVLGSIIGLVSFALLVGGVIGLVVDQTQRDSADYLSSARVDFDSEAYAVVGPGLDIQTDVPDWLQVRDVVGEVQIRFDAGDDEVFVGLAREADVAPYLAELGYDEVTRIDGDAVTYREHAGGAPAGAPDQQDVWAASASGTGEQTLTFEPQDGRWVVVAMNSDGSADVDVAARVAAELPVLTWIAAIVAGLGLLGLVVAALVIYLAVRQRPAPVAGASDRMP